MLRRWLSRLLSFPLPSALARAGRRAAACYLALLLIANLLVLTTAAAADKVVLQLKWTHQFQFAGYYAAIEQGYYRDAGLEVELREARPGLDVVREVLDGRADFAVGNSDLLIYRGRGEPVMVLAVILQHSAFSLAAREDRASFVHELAGQRVMLEQQAAELLGYLQQEGVVDQIQRVDHDLGVDALLRGDVAAMSVYLTDEVYLLREARLPFVLFTPRAAGIDFYGDNLFTRESVWQAQPERVRAFRAASLKGWQYAMAHQQEMADLIRQKYAPHRSREHLLFEAQAMEHLMQAQLLEIGHMHAGRWQHIAGVYAGLGMMPADMSLEGFLYDERAPQLPRWWLLVIGGSAAALFLVAMVAIRFAHLNARLQAREEQYRLLAEHSNDVIWVLDLASKRYVYVSPSVLPLRGYTPEEVMVAPLGASLTAESEHRARAAARDLLQRWRQGERNDPHLLLELEQRHKDGRHIPVEVSITLITNERGDPQALHGVTREISERVQARKTLQAVNQQLRARLEQIETLQDTLREQALRDSLTGLFNRRYLDEALPLELAQAQRAGESLALVMIDVDHFKQINDTHGHPAGDEVLKALATVLRQQTRAGDILCRYGGEEFIVVLPHMTLNDACIRAEVWRRCFAEISATHGDVRLQSTLSAGVAVFPLHGRNRDELITAADAALYRAKRDGRNRIDVAQEPAMAVQ